MAAVEPVSELQAEEGALYRLLAKSVSTKCLIDVGAHHGTALRPFLQAGWRVHAFEPIEANRTRLAANFPDHPRLTVRPEAVSEADGSATLHLATHPDGSLHDFYHSLERIGDDPWHRKGKDVTVPVVSLDQTVARGEIPTKVGFLKVDTEGHDLAVLRGAAAIDCEVIAVEFWCDGHALGRSPSPPAEMVHLLGERGYPHYLVVRHRGADTTVLNSTLEGVGGADWGNILFFRADRGELHRLVADCVTPAVFEPSADSYAALRERFAGNYRVEIFQAALSSRDGSATFYRAGEAYNNSLLPPLRGDASSVMSPVQTLDRALAGKLRSGESLDMLKVDAQGHDLHILRGAAGILREHQPAVLVEVIFADLYSGQDSYCDIIKHMADAGYRLGAWLHAHSAPGGADAFADVLFLPPRLHARVAGAGADYVCLDADHLRRQNEVLQKAADERLELIHRLNATAEERLAVIQSLESQLRRRSLKRWLTWAR
jgi:FkbM family methyltransferase